jgi:hypothetical protein
LNLLSVGHIESFKLRTAVLRRLVRFENVESRAKGFKFEDELAKVSAPISVLRDAKEERLRLDQESREVIHFVKRSYFQCSGHTSRKSICGGSVMCLNGNESLAISRIWSASAKC